MADRQADAAGAVRGWCWSRRSLLALVPFVAAPVPVAERRGVRRVSVGAFAGSLFGVLVLVAVPVLMLGAVSPWAIRLKLRAVEDSGEVAGRHVRDLDGRLAARHVPAALLLIPLVGTQRTFLIFALVAARWSRRSGSAPRLGARAAGDRGAAGGAGRDDQGLRARARVIDEADTEYQYARVVEYARRRAPAGAQRGPGDPLALPAGHRADRRLLGRASSSIRSPCRRARPRRSRCSAPPPARSPAPTRSTSRTR